ncbi:MAG: hypothetical protein GOV02_00270 [Candidatus Aenigmarchaeota archaeon]|nr:hypothetical protein [Candidatus Aenigmarchaeota archaeon]
MNPIEHLLKKFNFRKENGTCFSTECNNEATHKIVVKEVNLRLKTEKELAEIKLCEEHTPMIKTITRELNEELSGNFIVYRFEMKPI